MKRIRDISVIEKNKIDSILKSVDTHESYETVNIIPNSSDLADKLQEYIQPVNISQKTVLGFDIYRYSKLDTFRQSLIPYIFNLLHDMTIDYCLQDDQYIFQNESKKALIGKFISTGDGGFQIVDTPIHGITFLVNFCILLREFNSFHLFPKLRKIIGNIDIRFAMTLGDLYYYDYSNYQNFYGSSIINNAKIMSKDMLNRFLIDENVFNWFMERINGAENLQILTLNEIKNISDFSDYKTGTIHGNNYVFPDRKEDYSSGINSSDVLKLGTIESKGDKISIYNLYLKVYAFIGEQERTEESQIFTISIGNLNSEGIN